MGTYPYEDDIMKTFTIGLALAAGFLISAPVLADSSAATSGTAASGLSRFVVCADPGNMPLSSDKGGGFENKIGEILGNALGTGVSFKWWPSVGHGIMRKTLGSSLCDAWMDMVPHTEGAATTTPLYRSTFVLVSRKDEHLHIKNLSDPKLKKIKLGVYQLSAAREALTQHGNNNTVIQYLSYDGFMNPKDQPSYQVQQVADGSLDAVAIWGPFAGYYKTIKHEPLVIQPLNLMSDYIPLQFDMALALPKDQPKLMAAVEKAMRQSKTAIKQVLVDYGVPLVECKQCIISGKLPAHAPYNEQQILAYNRIQIALANKGGGVSLAQLKQTLAQGANPNDELQDAIVGDSIIRVRYLINHGADVNNVDNNGYPALINATRFGDNSIAFDLIRHNADVNVKDISGWTPLMYAAWGDNATMVIALAAKGANLEAVNAKGVTPLGIAAENGKSKAEGALITAGADVNKPIAGGGYTPLMLAAISGSQGAAQQLIEHGAKINAKNPGGVTALMIAAAHNYPQLVSLLLQNGADATVKTADGRTALDLSQSHNHPAVVKLLQAAAAAGKST